MFCKVQDKGATLADITNAVKDLPFVSDKDAFYIYIYIYIKEK
jgi:hypothetical protein